MNELLTLKEVGRILHVHPETVRLWIRDRIMQAIRTPGARPRYRIKRETLDALLNQSFHNGERRSTTMKEEQGVPVPEEVQKVLQREQEQAKGLLLADFSTQAVLLRVNKLLVFYGNDGWQCSCQIWQEHQSCRHLMALSMLVPSFPSLDLKDLAEGFKKE